MKAVAAGAITLRAGEITELAVAMTELAEDLHTESGLWRAVEGHNHATFGTPLPLVYRVGDPTLDPFDVRRFQFFLYSVWHISNADRLVSPPRTAVSWPSRARPEAFFSAAFAAQPRKSSVTALLVASNTRGWEIKRLNPYDACWHGNLRGRVGAEVRRLGLWPMLRRVA
jgi:hypothetical protein